MLRVYHFILDHRIGGPHIYVDTIRKALSKTVESFIVTTNRGSMTDIALLNLRHLWAPLYVLEVLLNSMLLVVLALLGNIARDMTIFNVHGGGNIAPIIAARIIGVPVVWHFHETTPRFCWLVNIGKWVLKKHPHRLVVVAHKAGHIYGLENADFIPAAVDEKFWSRNKVSDEGRELWCGVLGRNKETLRILSVGNLNPLKGIDVLLGALGGLVSSYEVKIVGSELKTHAAYARSLYAHASEITALKKECTIEFMGWQEKGRIRSLLAGCDVFILPSRSEACPIVLLEAMAMKCICVASDVGDVKAMLADYTRGKVFPSGSVEDLRLCLGVTEIEHLKRQVLYDKTNDIYRLESMSRKIWCVYSSLIP